MPSRAPSSLPPAAAPGAGWRRRTWTAVGPLVLASLAGAGLACAPEGPAGPVRRVLLISCDTLRADRLGCYGYGRDTTPNLDAFAREAVRYDEAYATAPMTVPAVGSLLTGRYPREIGTTHDNHLHVPPEVETLPEVLAAHGIPSAAVVSNFVLRRVESGGRVAGTAQGFLHYDDRMTHREKNRDHFERLAPETTDAAIAWLSEHADEDGPLFFWVHYMDPHGPYTPPADVAERMASPEPEGPELRPTNWRFGKGGIPSYQVLGDERRAGVYRDLYDAEIRFFDRELGRLLDWLRANGFFEDTLIVFTSDHGESLGEHDYWFCHGENTYREEVRVPLLVRYPEGLEPPVAEPDGPYRRCARVAGHVDLWATFLEALGVPPPPSRGLSLLGEVPERRLLWQFLHPESGHARWLSIADGRHQVVWDEVDGYRIYDVRSDPGQEHDLSARLGGTIERMTKELQDYIAETPPGALPRGVGVEESEEEQEALRKLGYAGGSTGGG